MEENKKIAGKNIKFEYPDNVTPDAAKEHSMINNINHWLGQFSEQINGQEGVIVVYLDDQSREHVHLDLMSDELQTTLLRQLQKFQLPDNRHSDSPGT